MRWYALAPAPVARAPARRPDGELRLKAAAQSRPPERAAQAPPELPAVAPRLLAVDVESAPLAFPSDDAARRSLA